MLSNQTRTRGAAHHPYLTVISSLIVACTLGGCGDKDRNPDPPRDLAPKPVGQNNVFGDMVATKDKASDGVNKAMDENKKKLDEAMQQQDAEQAPSAAEQ